jgi:hypothetical protein
MKWIQKITSIHRSITERLVRFVSIKALKNNIAMASHTTRKYSVDVVVLFTE